MTELQHPAAFLTAPPRRVIFIGQHNAASSQMAEGYARRMAPAGTEIWSAGAAPGRVHPLAIRVMAEVDIDLTPQRSKAIADVPWQEADTIVTLCGEGEDCCPVVDARVRRVHWPLPDPARAPEAEAEAAFREVRDEIHWRVAALWPPGDR